MSFKTTHTHTRTHPNTHSLKKIKQILETEVFQLPFKECINFLEGIALKLRFENRKSAGQRTKFILQEECGADISNITDLLTNFDGVLMGRLSIKELFQQQWKFHIKLLMIVCFYHVTYHIMSCHIQIESTFYICLNVKELLSQNKHPI